MANKIFCHDNMAIKWKEDGVKYCLHILLDENSGNPRDNDNVATLACFHRRYSLGDKINSVDPSDYFQNMVRHVVPGDELLRFAKERGMDDDCIDELEFNDCFHLLHPYAAILPLWLYDHSGISICCGTMPSYPYTDRWDGSQVGFGFILKEKAMQELCNYTRDEHGNRIRVEHKHEGMVSTWSYKSEPLTEENWRSIAEEHIRAEAEEYDSYLRGEVYGWKLLRKANDSWKEEDSCYGYIGDDLFTNGILDEHPGLKKAMENGTAEIGEAKLRTVSYFEYGT